MLTGAIQRETPHLTAIGRRWASYAVLGDGRTPQQAGVVSASPVQRIDPVQRISPSDLEAWRSGLTTEQTATLPFYFRPVAAFRASALLAERALSRLDLRWPSTENTARAKSEMNTAEMKAGETKAAEPESDTARPAATERADTSEAPPAPAPAQRAPQYEAMGLSYDAAF